MDRRIKHYTVANERSVNKAKVFFRSAWFWGCLGIAFVSTIAYLTFGRGSGEETKAPESKPKVKVTRKPKTKPPSPPKTKTGGELPSESIQAETPPPQPPPPPSNDVGRVVKDAFGREFKIEAVVAPRGPRRNGVEIIRDRRLFVSNAENALDGIVNQEMGDRFLGDFDEKQFEKEFLAAMINKIEVTEEDNEDEARRKDPQPCIRCAKCVGVCPMGLEPYLLAKLSEVKNWERAEREDIVSCIECGSCQFTCPAHRPLLDNIRQGKSTVMGIIRSRAAKK